MRKITAIEKRAFLDVLNKLDHYDDRSRKNNVCWLALKQFVGDYGHWKALPRGKPGFKKARMMLVND